MIKFAALTLFLLISLISSQQLKINYLGGETITFYKDKFAVDDGLLQIPQLQCVSDDNVCEEYTFNLVQCSEVGEKQKIKSLGGGWTDYLKCSEIYCEIDYYGILHETCALEYEIVSEYQQTSSILNNVASVLVVALFMFLFAVLFLL